MQKIKMSMKKINGTYNSITQRIILLTFQHKPFGAWFGLVLSALVHMYHLNSSHRNFF